MKFYVRLIYDWPTYDITIVLVIVLFVKYYRAKYIPTLIVFEYLLKSNRYSEYLIIYLFEHVFEYEIILYNAG